MNDRNKDDKISLFPFTLQNFVLSYVPLDSVLLELKRARCRLLVIFPDGHYHCLAFGKIKTQKVCNPCPNPSHQVTSIGITEKS
ncbi:MAG: hypothetical protein ACFFAJ_07440 [Candidatus Hodarchaeota archaeon]